MGTSALSGGFSEPATDAAQAFREIMEVMARPGEIRDLSGATPPPPMSQAAGTVLLTLCDADTPLHLAGAADCTAIREWVAFHTGAPIVGPARATFALGTWDALLPLDAYPVGIPEYPDRSVTLIVETPNLEAAGASLQGPGIAGQASLSLPEIKAFQTNRLLFPLGRDFIFTSRSAVAALPRTTEVH